MQFVDSYIEYKNRYLSQQNELGSYLDQFIALINYMKGVFPLYNPKVIVVLNIVSETAEQNRAVVDYLLSEDINITGIEMGNECYDKFHCNALGMGTFNQYYWYITGNNILGYENVFQLEDLNYVLMKDHHDFIGAFRGENFLNVKIGLVARGHAANSEYPLRMLEATCNEDDDDWNLPLYNKYLETVSGYPEQKMFDAVIIHSYFETNQYEGILLGDDTHDGINPNLFCSDDDASPYYDAWWFDSFDPRLYDAFVELRTAIKDFVKNGFNESYDAYNATFHFDLPVAAGGKELWPTEWNLKTKRPSYNEAQQNMAMIMSNNFMNGVLIQEWWLRYLKLGFRNGYRQGFITNATFHSFSGGVWEFMLTPANGAERDELGKDIYPYNLNVATSPAEFRNYYVKRTTMFIAEMFSQIPKKSLRYLPSNFAMGASSPNVAPTVFIDQLKQNLYIYYSNVTGVEQDFKIYPTLLVDLLGADDVAFGNATIYCIKASKPYSTSGKSKFYNYNDNLSIPGNGIINSCYETENPDPLIEIDQIFALPNSPNCTGDYVVNGCISVPAYSCGYIKVPIAPVYNEAKLSVTAYQNNSFVVYPNPTAVSIAIFNTTKPVDETNYTLEIVGTDGRVVATQNATVAQQLNVQALPAGAYQCRIIDAEKVISISKFIKL